MQFIAQLNNIIINSSLLSPGLTVEDDDMFYLVHLNECLNDVSASDNATSTNVNIPCDEFSVDEIISTLHPEAQKLVIDSNLLFQSSYQNNCHQNAQLSIRLI